jgi:hypothetical protein
MFDVSFNEEKITFVNTKTAKAESIVLLDRVDDVEAIVAIAGEQKAAEKASVKAISLLCSIMDNPRLDGWKGITPINETIPKELKQAIRELETEHIKPIFSKYHADKGATPAKIEQLWQAYAGFLRQGGSYANAKSKVTAYFAHCGKLPVTDNGKLLPLAAIERLLQNAKESAPKNAPSGIAGKLMKLAEEVENRNESTVIGDIASAIQSLRAMLATFEGLEREALDSAMLKYQASTPGDVTALADNAISKAQRAFNELQTQWEEGLISDGEFAAKAHELGYDVDIKEEEEIAPF